MALLRRVTAIDEAREIGLSLMDSMPAPALPPIERRAEVRLYPEHEEMLAKARAELPMQTITFCMDHKLPPIPQIYEVVYNYLDGSDATLNSIILAELAHGPLTYSFLMDLYYDFFHVASLAKGLGKIGDGLGEAVDQVSATIDLAMKDGRTNSEKLHRLNRALPDAPSRAHLMEIAREINRSVADQINVTSRMGEALRGAQERIGALEREIAKYATVANTDHLTSLANRRAMDEAIGNTLKRSFASMAPECFIMIDIDRFKHINDNYGHDVGDSILKKVADMIRNTVGNDGTATPGRWGGEEFAILVTRGGQSKAVEIAERIRRTLESLIWSRRGTREDLGTVTASFGISVRLSDDNAASFTKRADEALYRAKHGGRNRTFVEEREIAQAQPARR